MSKYEDLERLGKMLDDGKIDRDEYERLKADLLAEESSNDWPEAPTVQASEAPSTPQQEVHRSRIWLLAAAALLILGSFMPWAQAGIFSFSGTQGDGALTLVAGVLIGIIGFFKPKSSISGITAIVVSGLSLLIVGNVFNNLAVENAGSGLLIAGGGGLVGIIGGVRALEDARSN